MSESSADVRQRLDKWLWFARVIKSRTSAAKLVEDGHVRINAVRADNPAKGVRPGDVLTVALDRHVRVLKVLAAGARRGPYAEARLLYEELTERPDGPQGNRIWILRGLRVEGVWILPGFERDRAGGIGVEDFAGCWEGLDDPRTGNARLHDFHELLMMALCAVLSGGQGAADMALFAKAKEPFLRGFLKLENGVPSHDTFSRLFRQLDPAQFGLAFQRFMARFRETCAGVVAIDGKVLRRSFDRASGTSPLHMVSAWGCEQRMVLAQVATDAKSNEITAVPALLAMLSLKGTVVTADALNCQRAIAGQIIDQGGDYCLALKGNQGTLHDDVSRYLDDPESQTVTMTPTVDGDHGRIETRAATITTAIDFLADHRWPGLAAIGKVVRQRDTGEKTTTETAYYLLSRSLSPERFNEVVRFHWGIENSLHWRLDVVMNEDHDRTRMDNAPQNLAIIRHMALNIMQANKATGSLRGKFKRAGWDDAYLSSLIAQI